MWSGQGLIGHTKFVMETTMFNISGLGCQYVWHYMRNLGYVLSLYPTYGMEGIVTTFL